MKSLWRIAFNLLAVSSFVIFLGLIAQLWFVLRYTKDGENILNAEIQLLIGAILPIIWVVDKLRLFWAWRGTTPPKNK
jgi:hypothetical protein